MPTHEPLKRLSDTLEASLKSVEQLVEAVSDEQFCWRPAANAWSIGEVLEHLSLVAESYVPLLEPAIERARQAGITSERSEYRYPWLWRTFTRVAGPQGRRSVRAPKPFRPATESAQLTRDGVMQRFRTVHQQLGALLDAADGLDLRRVRHRNPVIRVLRMPVGTSFEVLVGHLERHLAQMQRLQTQATQPG